ncbi:MAG TPA: DUF3467 domain-containing protein [Terriglobales bacterium]
MPEEKPPRTPQTGITKHDNFESWYANNVQFYPSEWDLRMVFGELDMSEGGAIVQQHTAMTVAWVQAKLMQYFLTLQLGVYEMTHGKIPVPDGILPPEPTPPTGELEHDPVAIQVYEYIKKARDQFMASLS